MPALRVLGQRLSYIASDDLRTISKAVCVVRLAQVLVWIPTVWLLLETTITHNDNVMVLVVNDHHDHGNGSAGMEKSRNSTAINLTVGGSAFPCPDEEHSEVLIVFWLFSILSAVTIVSSIILEAIIFRISSRGTPVQVEERQRLSLWCAVKLGPLTMVRCVTVALAIYTLLWLPAFCRNPRWHRLAVVPPHAEPAAAIASSNGTTRWLRSSSTYPNSTLLDCIPRGEFYPSNASYTLQFTNENDFFAPHQSTFCPKYTVTIVMILASSHVLEMLTAGWIVVALMCRHVKKASRGSKQWYQYWFTRIAQWVLPFASSSSSSSVQTGQQSHESTTANGNVTSLSPRSLQHEHRQQHRESWWHSCCHCFCVIASCCTCCLFGGSEVLRQTSKSSSLRSSDNQNVASEAAAGSSSSGNATTSVLSDISILLAEYFDTGPQGTLDVTPSDLLVGLTVLRMEQQRQKQDRMASLRLDLGDDAASTTSETSRRSHSIRQRIAGRNNRRRNRQLAEKDASASVDGTAGVAVEVDVERGDGGQAIVSIESVATGSFETGSENTDGSHEEESGDDMEDVEQANNVENANGEPSGHPTRRKRERPNMSGLGSVRNLQLVRTSSTAQATFRVSTRPRLRRELESDRLAIVEGAHYMRVAIAVYGHMMYLLQHTCTAPCCLVAGLLTCRPRKGSTSRQQSSNHSPTIVGDNRCGCNELGFLHMAGLNRDDIAYVSFKSGIQLCPYGIVLDKIKQAVVIAIRGTFSLEAMVADLNIQPELLGEYGEQYEAFRVDTLSGAYAHSGMLRCAFEIYNDLQRHKILDRLLLGASAKFPGFKVVVTGHSLGAGIGSILSLMLSQQFEGLRCLCFSPPGCVMSEQACVQDYITSYVLESDIVPRLSFHSMVGLRNDILEMIARIKVPKHVALACDSNKGRKNGNLDVLHPRDAIPESAFYSRIQEFHEHHKRVSENRLAHNIRLHAPGAIVHVVEHSMTGSRSSLFGIHHQPLTYVPTWAERSDFSEIQLTKSMAIDHDPERLFRILKALADSFQ